MSIKKFFTQGGAKVMTFELKKCLEDTSVFLGEGVILRQNLIKPFLSQI